MMLSTPEVVRGTGSLVSHRDLQQRYGSYRRAQAARLVRLLPREAIRPLYRRAREMDPGRPEELEDPLSLLVRYCETILPLPPFEVWRDDLERNPEAHLKDLDQSAAAPTASAPSTLEVRQLRFEGRPWRANLRSFRDQGVWRGFISFEAEPGTRVHRTTAIFCESDLTELRERFLSFTPATLEAFLRSSLP